MTVSANLRQLIFSQPSSAKLSAEPCTMHPVTVRLQALSATNPQRASRRRIEIIHSGMRQGPCMEGSVSATVWLSPDVAM